MKICGILLYKFFCCLLNRRNRLGTDSNCFNFILKHRDVLFYSRKAASYMAALLGTTHFWNASAKTIIDEYKRLVAMDSYVHATSIGATYVLLSVVTVVGNALVIFAVWKDPLKILRASPTNYILLSLAIADLIVGLIIDPGVASWFLRARASNTDPWYFQTILTTFLSASLIVSVGHVLFLTVDRYFALATPLKYRTKITKRRVVITCSLIWIGSICCSVATSFVVQQYFAVVWLTAVVVICLSAEHTYILYIIILRHLFKHSRARIAIQNSQSNSASLYQREKKVFRVIVSVIFVFDSCLTPWMVTQFVLYFCASCHDYYKEMVICYNVSTVFFFLNSALNPFLYSWRFSKFRATFKYFWNNVYQRRRRTQTVRISERRLSLNTQL